MVELEDQTESILPKKQQFAIHLKGKYGRQLQKDHPEIVDDFRGGSTHKDIVRDYDVEVKFGVTESIARGIVRHALVGCDFPGYSYTGLLESEELSDLAEEHHLQALEKMREDERGIFGITKEENKEYGRQGGKIGGQKSLEMKVGVHGKTGEEKKEMIKKALATKGYIYPSPQEEAYIWEAAQNPERKRCGGVNLDELTKDVNSLFPESGRSKKQVSRILDRLRRKKGAKTKEKITDEQKDFVIDLAKKYQHRNGRVKRKIVAEKYNDHFHDGKPVRDGVFVNNVLRDYRNKL